MASYTKEECTTTFNAVGVVAGKKLGFGSYRQDNSSYKWILHTAPSGTTSLDEIWIWAYNSSTSYNLQMGWGTSASTGSSNMFQMYFPSYSPAWLVGNGVLMQDSDNVWWQSSSQYAFWCNAYVNRLTY